MKKLIAAALLVATTATSASAFITSNIEREQHWMDHIKDHHGVTLYNIMTGDIVYQGSFVHDIGREASKLEACMYRDVSRNKGTEAAATVARRAAMHMIQYHVRLLEQKRDAEGAWKAVFDKDSFYNPTKESAKAEANRRCGT